MASIITSKGDKIFVDKSDLEFLNRYTWSLNDKGYAQTSTRKPCGSRTKVKMHRLLLGATKGQIVDHRDRNPLNNRRSNLRICNDIENAQNRSVNSNNTTGFKGVSYNSRHGIFKAQIGVDGNKLQLGSFKTAVEAAYVYDEAAKRIFGNFALTNEMLGLLKKAA